MFAAMALHAAVLPVQRQGVGLLYSCLMAADGVDAAALRQAAHAQGMRPAIEAATAAHPKDKAVCNMCHEILGAAR